MGNLVNLISGKKTYTSVAAFVIYRVATQQGWISPIPGAEEVLGGAVLMAFRSAVAKIEGVIKPPTA